MVPKGWPHEILPRDPAHKLALVGFHAQQDMDRNVVVLDFDMELWGKSLNVAPDFIKRIQAIVAHEECGVRKVSSKTEVQGVDFEIYRLDPDDPILKTDGTITITLSNTILAKLAVTRPQKPVLLEKEIKLHFSLAYEYDNAVWHWAQAAFSTAFWCKFSGRQAELRVAKDEDENPAQGVLDAMANMAELTQQDGGSVELLDHTGKSVLKIDDSNSDDIIRRAGRTPKKTVKKKGKR